MSGKADNVVALISTLVATAVAKKTLDTTWKVGSKGKTPPTDPADPDIELREAVVFAVLSGAVISVARLLIARKLAQKGRREARVQRLSR